MGKKRLVEIDLIKGMGIICMVAGHAGAPFTHFIYLFHMAIFFVASGFLYSERASRDVSSVLQTIRRRLRSLWVPFFVWNMVYVLLHNLFIHVNVYTDNPAIVEYVSGKHIHTTAFYTLPDMLSRIAKGLLFGTSEELFVASWFLKSLFVITVVYVVVDYVARRLGVNALLVQSVVSVALLALGFACSVKGMGFMGLEKAASFYCLYFTGRILALRKEIYAEWGWRQQLPICLASFGVLLVLNRLGSIELVENYYQNPAFLVACTLAGWAFLYSASFFIKRLPLTRRVIVGIGKRTLAIVILHFLAFKIVETLVVASLGMPSFCIAAFPNLYGERGLWWLAYTIVGVAVPVVLKMFHTSVVARLPRPRAVR